MWTFWQKFRDLLGHHLGADLARPDSAAGGPLQHLLDPLDDLRQKTLERAQLADEKRQDAVQRELQEAQRHQAQMLEDILALHQELQTGLDQAALESLSFQVKQHCQEFRSQARDRLVELALVAVQARFHEEALLWGWNEFERLRQSKGLKWPDPSGLSPHADAQEIQTHRDLEWKQARQQFLHSNLLIQADICLGIVPAWRAFYPERGGSVWRQTTFEAVAGALAAQRWRQIEALALQHHQGLEEKMAKALEAALEEIHSHLSQGVGSLAEARRLSEQAAQNCQQIAPQVVWGFLGPLLEGQS